MFWGDKNAVFMRLAAFRKRLLEDIVNEEMLTTEDVNNMLEHTDKERTKLIIRNCVTVFQNAPVLKKRLNEMNFPKEWTL